METRRGRQALDLFVAELPPGHVTSMDEPKLDAGIWWLDVHVDGLHEVVGWYPEKGYAMSTDPNPGYGENPDVWEAEPAAAARRFLEIVASRGTDAPRA